MNATELKIVLEKHAAFLRGEPGGMKANLRRANLRGAKLRGADLSEADLSRANLRLANLSGADLRWAKLRGADLSEADLSRADLRLADLRWANLSGADLRGAKSGSVCRMDFDGWSICIREDKTSIGCQTHDNAKWLKWTPKDVTEMHDDARAWWTLHSSAVKAAIRVVIKNAKKGVKNV